MIAFVNILPLLDKLSIYLLFYYINIIYSKEKIIKNQMIKIFLLLVMKFMNLFLNSLIQI